MIVKNIMRIKKNQKNYRFIENLHEKVGENLVDHVFKKVVENIIKKNLNIE